MEGEKKTNKRIVFSIIAVLLLVAVVAGATYAYFSATANTNTQTVTTGTLTMGFTNGDLIRATGITPISDSEIKTKAVELPFSVTNTGNQHMKLTIKLTDITISDALKDIDFRWGLYNADTEVGLSFGFFKNIGTSTEEIIYRDTIIDAADPDITKNYKLRIWIHDDGAIQNEMQGQTFSAKVRVYGEVVEYTKESCFKFDSSTGAIIEYTTGEWIIDEETGEDVWVSTDCPTDVVIPKTIDGVNVTTMTYDETNQDGAFDYQNLTSVIIPESFTSIDGLAFDGNQITHVTIPESVTTIGGGAFSHNKLTELVIPVSNTAGFQAGFQFDGNLLTDVVLMEGITNISRRAFGGNLTSIEIPSSVTIIDDGGVYGAFSNNLNLNEIILRGKTEVPSGFVADWNCTEYDLKTFTCTKYANIIFRP